MARLVPAKGGRFVGAETSFLSNIPRPRYAQQWLSPAAICINITPNFHGVGTAGRKIRHYRTYNKHTWFLCLH